MEIKMEHKEGCIYGDGNDCVHRVPIDCVTVKDLLKRIEYLNTEGDGLKAENMRLKAEIYDLKTELEER